MRIATYAVHGRTTFGVVGERGLMDFGRRFEGRFADLFAVLQANALGELAQGAGTFAADHALDAVQFLPPIPRPEKIICVGVNYANRNEEYRDSSPAAKYPSLFMRTPGSLVGHGQPIVRPLESDQFDYEGEAVVIIGRGGRRISASDAHRHIAGFTIMNEGTVRDWVRHGKFNVTPGKNFDRSGAIGPWMATLDDMPPLDRITVKTWVNGELRQDDVTANMMFPIPRIIEYVSSFTALTAGDLIATGTPTGAGARFDPPRYLKAGDVVEVEVSGVGRLRNPVVEEQA